jgi:hypothetical protein
MRAKMIPSSDWTDEEWNKFSVWIVDVLKENTATVTFVKKDGETRVMNCTLKSDLLPKVEIVEGTAPKPERKKSDTSIAVYDLDVKDWRSFTTKSVIRVSTVYDLIGEGNDKV